MQAPPLTTLFVRSLESGSLPKDWKKATAIAILKKREKTDSRNYRPVSLTCVLCKVLESIIKDAVVDYLDNNKLITNCQHGFRKGRSCVTQLLEVMQDFVNYSDEGLM